MKTTKKKRRNVEISSEEAMEKLQEIFKKRGSKALEMARKEVLQEKIECKEAREALAYFITEYWHDLARPTLLSLACEAVGGDPELTTPIAVPMILISGAIDIHDDIIDQSKTKDGRQTIYGKFGTDIALLVGDALLFKGFALLTKATADDMVKEKTQEILNIVKNTFFELGDAEALELCLRAKVNVPPEEYLRIVEKKAADVEAHTRIGAILGGAPKREIEILGKYGRVLGMTIILRDDWIDIINLEESIHRVKKECLPLPILYALQEPKIGRELGLILSKKYLSKKDAGIILQIVHKAKGIRRYEKTIRKLEKEGDMVLQTIANKDYLELFLRAMHPPTERTLEFLPKTTNHVSAS